MVLQPAAAPAWTSVIASPTIQLSSKRQPQVREAASSMPGLGFRHTHRLAGSCGQMTDPTMLAPPASNSSMIDWWMARISSAGAKSRSMTAWLVTMTTFRRSLRRRTASTAPGIKATSDARRTWASRFSMSTPSRSRKTVGSDSCDARSPRCRSITQVRSVAIASLWFLRSDVPAYRFSISRRRGSPVYGNLPRAPFVADSLGTADAPPALSARRLPAAARLSTALRHSLHACPPVAITMSPKRCPTAIN